MKFFLTVGTQLPFDRLVRAVDDWVGAAGRTKIEMFGQIGDVSQASYTPKNFDWTEFLEPDEFADRFAAATHVIAHAGMGTIISALMAGKPILILPRRASLEEQRNDHQLSTVDKFAGRPGVYAVLHEREVHEALSNMNRPHLLDNARVPDLADRSLTDAIRNEIMA
ncbi:MAG: glycosyltransferase [Paracoccaceae bacterium]